MGIIIEVLFCNHFANIPLLMRSFGDFASRVLKSDNYFLNISREIPLNLTTMILYLMGRLLGIKPISLLLSSMIVMLSCSKAGTTKSSFNLLYDLEREYTGKVTNKLDIEILDEGKDEYFFSISSPLATADIAEDVLHPLENQTISFTYGAEGVYSADFKVARKNGTPYIHQILTWEYSTVTPDPPVISFANSATRFQSLNLTVSDSRTTDTTEIWLTGDIEKSGKTIVDDGYWEELPLSQLVVPITLTAGDGYKTVSGKFRNIFGNESEEGYPAQILLKQTAPTNCDATPISTTINTNKLSLQLNATDPYQMYFSVMGAVRNVINQQAFTDGEIVYIFVEPTPGSKTIVVTMDDIAGNNCLQKEVVVTVDPEFESEAIVVNDATYWTNDDNITLDVFFEHFPDQDPIQLKITGDVSGPNVNTWIPYQTDIPVTFNPTTSGSKRIYAQYKDSFGDESYLITKRIYLKPSVVLQDIGAPDVNVVASQIIDATSMTITGCSVTYNEVTYQAAFPCTPIAASISVTWNFEDGPALVISETP